MAAPGRPLWDVAMAARYWVPVLDPETAARLPSFDNHGGWATWDRLQAWLADQHAAFLAALVGGTDR